MGSFPLPCSGVLKGMPARRRRRGCVAVGSVGLRLVSGPIGWWDGGRTDGRGRLDGLGLVGGLSVRQVGKQKNNTH